MDSPQTWACYLIKRWKDNEVYPRVGMVSGKGRLCLTAWLSPLPKSLNYKGLDKSVFHGRIVIRNERKENGRRDLSSFKALNTLIYKSMSRYRENTLESKLTPSRLNFFKTSDMNKRLRHCRSLVGSHYLWGRLYILCWWAACFLV